MNAGSDGTSVSCSTYASDPEVYRRIWTPIQHQPIIQSECAVAAAVWEPRGNPSRRETRLMGLWLALCFLTWC
jgi:hypothetical protein